MPHTSLDGGEFLRVVLDAADIGCWEWHVRSRTLIGDGRCRALLGLPADAELTPARLLERVDPIDRERVIAEVTRALAGEGAFRSALRLAAADGRVRWLEVRGRASAGDDDPAPTRLRGVALLVSDRDPPEYARLFELSVDMLAVASTVDGRWKRVNPAFERTLGWTEAELLATPYRERVHPEDRARSQAAAEPLAGGPPVGFEERVRCKDGGYKWIAWNTSADAGGLMFCVGRDMTARRAAEEALRASDERFRSVFAEAAVGLAIRDRESRFLEVNPAFCALTGHDPAALRTMTVWQLVHPDDLADNQALVARLLAGELAGFVHECRYVRKDGRVVWVRKSVSLTRDPEGAPQWIFALLEDINEHKRAELALRESEDRFRALANNISQFAWMADPTGAIFWYNQRWYDYTGTTFEAMRGWGWQAVHHPDHLDGVVDRYRRAIAAGEVWEDTFPLRSRAGAYRWFLSRAVPVRDDAGDVRLWFGTNTDVTELRAIQEELGEAKAAADAANRAKSAFLANMSHELRTPMNAILGMTDLALREALSPTLLDYLQTARDSGELLLGLLNQLLDFSRIEAGQMELDRAPFRLRKAAMHVVRTLALRAHEKGLELILTVDDDVPDAVVGDPLRLRQVLFNLVGNAIKFTPAGEVVISAHVRRGADVADDEVALEFAVADTGVGISPADQELIFSPFQQAGAATARHHGGTGLGLAIVRSLVGMMGGEVGLESAPGRGSTFTFTVRLGRQPAALADDEADDGPLRDTLRGLRVLVVGESTTHRRTLQRTLAAWGVEVEVAADAANALAALHGATAAERPIELVLCESALAGHDGFALAEWLQRSSLARAVVLMIPATERGAQRERCRALGATCVTKPVSPSDLFDALTRALGLGRAPQAASGRPPRRPAGRPLRVLLAEDTPANQKLVTYLLRGRGHQVEVADDGQQALERLQRAPFDVVLMDVQMPVLGGVEATRAIRALADPTRARVPIIALTAHALRGDAERLLAAGMNAYLSKPIAGDELIALIERLAGEDEGADVDEPAAPPFDPAEALRICFGDREMVRAMIACLHEEADPTVAELRGAIDRGDPEALHRAAHRLKNTLMYLGAAPAEAAAGRLIELGQAGDLGPARAAVAALAAALARLQAALAAHPG